MRRPNLAIALALCGSVGCQKPPEKGPFQKLTEHLIALDTPESQAAYIKDLSQGAGDPVHCSEVLQSLIEPAPNGINILTDGDRTLAMLDLKAKSIQVFNRRAFEAQNPCAP